MRQRPNIIYLHTHDTGRQIQPYGQPVATPRIQGLAEQGVLFRQAHSAAPTCSPSRAALLTGQSPHSSGMMGLAHRGFSLNDYGQHLVNTLRPAGYLTAMVGQQHVSVDPAVIGYDEVLDIEGDRAAVVVPAAEKFLRQVTPNQPFFLSIGLLETHTMPTGGGTFGYPGGDDRYVAPAAALPNAAPTRADMASFAAAARVADDAVGRVLDVLDEQRLSDSTLVILTTDHGVAMPKMKCTLTDLGTGVMLIMRGPGGFSGGLTSDALVSQIDLFPTLCELLALEPPPWLEGRSFLGVLDGTSEVNEAVFSEVTYHVSYQPQRAVRTRRWKYIRHFSDWGRPMLANVDDSPSKDLLVQHGWRDTPVAPEQLYDLVLDPCEAVNLAADPAHGTVLAELQEWLADWMQRTADPLLAGPVPAPSGHPAADPGADSPTA